MATKTVKKAVKAKAPKSISELRNELLTLKRSLHDGTLTNPHAIKAVKKEIARSLTEENKRKGN